MKLTPETPSDVIDFYAINSLIVQYAKARDTTDAEIYRKIFTKDAVIKTGSGKVLSDGIDSILTKVAGDLERFNPDKEQSDESYAVMRHVVSNVEITIDTKKAYSNYYVTTMAYNTIKSRPEIISVARNQDTYEKLESGWRIDTSTLYFGWENDFMGQLLQLGPYTPDKYKR